MANILADFSGEFKRKRKVGDLIKANDIVGQIYDGNIWQNQHTSFGGTIDMLTETGVQVDVGDTISKIIEVAVLVAGTKPAAAAFTSEAVGTALAAPRKKGRKKKSRPAEKVSKKKPKKTAKKSRVKKASEKPTSRKKPKAARKAKAAAKRKTAAGKGKHGRGTIRKN